MEFSGKEIQENKVYLLMNKPKGYVCSSVSDSHRTVYELLPSELQILVKNAKRGNRLHTIGRLDCDTTGLLIFTTDGYLSDYLTRSENNISKTYAAVLKNQVSEIEQKNYFLQAQKGVLLPSEKKAPEEMSLPFNLQEIKNNDANCTAIITVTEGRFHEVRRIFRALGNEVIELKRTAILNLKLEEIDLKDGQIKIITKKELLNLLGI